MPVVGTDGEKLADGFLDSKVLSEKYSECVTF